MSNLIKNPGFENEWNGNHRVLVFNPNGTLLIDHEDCEIFVPGGWLAAFCINDQPIGLMQEIIVQPHKVYKLTAQTLLNKQCSVGVSFGSNTNPFANDVVWSERTRTRCELKFNVPTECCQVIVFLRAKDSRFCDVTLEAVDD